jgi:hypothetical protein
MDHDEQIALYARSRRHPEAARDLVARDIQLELVMCAACPLCGGPLTARCHPVCGPYFHCLCVERAAPPLRDRAAGAKKGKRKKFKKKKASSVNVVLLARGESPRPSRDSRR